MFLTLLRQVPELTDSGKTDMTAMTEGKPGIHQRYHFDMAAYDTVLTKIGLNLVAKLLGVPLIRNPAFDSAVTYARDGVRSNSPTPLARRLSTVMSWR
jgi:hypothetical protein